MMPSNRCCAAAFLALALTAGRSWSQEGAAAPPPEQAGSAASEAPAFPEGFQGLRLQRRLLPAAAPDAKEELPLFLSADRLWGYTDRDLEAAGHVELRRRGAALFADHLHYEEQTQEVQAYGSVRVERLGEVMTGTSLRYRLDQDSGEVEQPGFQLRQFHARGKAEQIVLRDSDRITATRATYTNCDVGDDDWYLTVGRLDLDRTVDRGVAHDATMHFKDVPVFYTPWIDFPLSTQRKTGLLPPTVGTSGKSGFEYSQPFYYNWAPDRDLTISPRVMARRGIQLNNELRYLGTDYSGLLQADSLPDDRIKGTSRSAIYFQHAQDFGGGLHGNINFQKVSDDTYFVDLSDKISVTSQTVLPREGVLTYSGGWWDAAVRAQRFQTLQDPLAPTVPPYDRVPQVTLNASRENVGGVDLAMQNELVYFRHPTLISGGRETFYPTVSYPLANSSAFFTPKLGYHYTRYNLDDPNTPDATRALPIASLDSGLTFERQTAFGGADVLQTLEPRLYYVYIPYRNQSQLPLFDTAQADFNLAQIFSENQFSGGDRINDADQVTAAVTSRLVSPASGAEILRATLGQRYYLRAQEVTLSGPPTNLNRSDLLAAVSAQVGPRWTVDTGTEYNVNDSLLQRFSVNLRHQPEPGKVINFGYRYARDSLNQVDASGQWPLSRNWSAVVRWNYSIFDRAVAEELAGLDYKAGCWTLHILLHRFATATQEASNTFFVQLELNGLSRIGSSPTELLRQSISGYNRASTRPSRPEDYFPGSDGH